MASAPSSLFRQPRYKGTSGSWHAALRRLEAGAWLLAFALLGGGCSVSYQLDGLHAFGPQVADKVAHERLG